MTNIFIHPVTATKPPREHRPWCDVASHEGAIRDGYDTESCYSVAIDLTLDSGLVVSGYTVWDTDAGEPTAMVTMPASPLPSGELVLTVDDLAALAQFATELAAGTPAPQLVPAPRQATSEVHPWWAA